MDEVSTTLSRPILSKAEWRERRRNLPFAEKIAILEKMRRRDALIAKAGLRRPRPDEDGDSAQASGSQRGRRKSLRRWRTLCYRR